MTDYSLAANRLASDMDGGGTDLISGDTVITNAFKLTLDIDCGFKWLTISNNGELEIEAFTYQVDDHRDAKIDAEAGSTISTTGLSSSLVANFISKRGDGAKPLMPWEFSNRGTMTMPYTRISGNFWSIRNANYSVFFSYGSVNIRPVIPANTVMNRIQGGISTIKWVGNSAKTYRMEGLIFGENFMLEDLLIEMSRSGESFSVITDVIHLDRGKIINLEIIPLGVKLRRFVMSIMEAV